MPSIHPSFSLRCLESSQLAAVVAAQRGKDFVLFGPPGAGKSQTIVNMISNCLAHGKSVLFVSQKTAALEVVRRRLNDIGLGGYCLEVHSTKAQKSSVIEQLAAAWRERGGADEESWTAANAELKAKRDELNRLVSALHRRRANGMSAFEAFGRVVADERCFPMSVYHGRRAWIIRRGRFLICDGLRRPPHRHAGGRRAVEAPSARRRTN